MTLDGNDLDVDHLRLVGSCPRPTASARCSPATLETHMTSQRSGGEPTPQVAGGQGSGRGKQREQSDRVGDEPRCDEQGAADEYERALNDLVSGPTARLERGAEGPPGPASFAPYEHRPQDAVEQQQSNGEREPDPPADRDDDGELDDRDDDEGK